MSRAKVSHLPEYDHSQPAPMYWLLIVIGIAIFVMAAYMPDAISQATVFGSGAMMFFWAGCFRHLNVRDGGDRLIISFGPLPLFRRSITYDRLVSAEPTKTTWAEGWGIHMHRKGGWTWNIWGFDCVHIRMQNGRQLHLGTDDPQALTAFLQKRIGKTPPTKKDELHEN